MEEKLKKVNTIAIVALIIALLDLVLILGSKIQIKNEDASNNQSNSSTTSEYDVSSFNTLTLSSLLNLFDNKSNTYVVYLGRPTCSACVKFLPTLKSMQNKYNYVTQYLDITTVDAQSSDFEKLMKKLDKEVTLTVNGETKTQEFGDFYGYTPMTFIIKNGKFKDGIVGAYSEAKFEKFLNDNGIK